jgi:hypothetical protein
MWQYCSNLASDHQKGYGQSSGLGGSHFGKHALLKEKERCDQRVMPNCGGVSSTPFFLSTILERTSSAC